MKKNKMISHDSIGVRLLPPDARRFRAAGLII